MVMESLSIDKNEIQQTLDRLRCERKWDERKNFLLRCIAEYPDEYYFFTLLSEACYSQKLPEETLAYAEKAMMLKGKEDDVWVNFYYGMALSLNDKYEEAIKQFDIILRKHLSTIAYNEHGEGMKSAKGLANDALYLKGRALMEMGDLRQAKKLIKKHLAHRQHGIFSEFSKKDIERIAKSLE